MDVLSFLPLLILIGIVVLVVKAFSSRSSGETLICTSCGTQTNKPESFTKGSILIEIVLWLAFIVPGLIYSLWRLTTRQRVCPACKAATLIPASTPAGRKLAQQFSEIGKQ
jgi:hypothetical protein